LWNNHCNDLLNWSKKWIDPQNPDFAIEEGWNLLIKQSGSFLETLMGNESIFIEPECEDEHDGEDELEEIDQLENNGAQLDEI
jgi:hypothetical protein